MMSPLFSKVLYGKLDIKLYNLYLAYGILYAVLTIVIFVYIVPLRSQIFCDR